MARYQVRLPGALEIDGLRQERDRVAQRVEKGCAFLAELGQDAPEFDLYFSEWEKILRQYERLCDRIELAELTARIRSSGSE